MDQLKQKQVLMHSDFFDRCHFAIDNGFYIEAIIMEYAAIESRLESICGQLGFLCGQDCIFRKDISVSSRIECLRVYWNNNKSVVLKSKLPDNFFSKNGALKKWIIGRNIVVHGLYKNAQEYTSRLENNMNLAENGLEYAKLLYNEAKRIGRLRKNHPEVFETSVNKCKNSKCKANISKE